MAFPHRNKIKEALISYMTQAAVKGDHVTPEKAYEALAQIFNLTEDDLKLRRPSGEETWPNEVRQARRELVEEHLISPPEVSGHGLWKLAYEIKKNEALNETDYKTYSSDLKEDGLFDPASISDARDIILRAIVQRRGQYDFRLNLLKAYESKCAITGEHFEGVLEAAHIVPYQGQATNVVTNGLLLRTDILTLFDLYLVSINPTSLCVAISPKLQNTGYTKYHGKPIFLPHNPNNHPSKAALEDHWDKCKF